MPSDIPDPHLRAALTAWGPDIALGEHLGGGHRNEVRAGRLAGRRVVVRRSRRTAEALAWELALLDHLHAAGLRVPIVVPVPDGRRQVDGVVVCTWLDGVPPASAADWRLVAAELDRLHRLTRDWPQRPGFSATRALLAADAGGDVHLDRMPPAVVARLRAAWRAIAEEPTAVVHGDPGPANLRIAGSRVGFLDWDEARVDAALLDLAALPLGRSTGIAAERLARARRALDAWEIANAWTLEPAYARRRLGRL